MAMNGRANEAYTIPVLVKGRRIVALVDSGASVNVVGAQLATELSLRVCTKDKPTTLYLGDGTPIQAAKEVKGLVLAVEDLLIPIDALVLDDVGYEMLLGRAFMTATEMTLNCKEETYTIEWQGDKRVIRASRGYKAKWEEENRRLQHERPRFTEVFRIDSPQPTQAELDEEDREKEAIRKREENKDAAEESEESETLKELRSAYPRLLDDDLGPLSKQVERGHGIETVGSPIKQRAYRVSPKEGLIIKEQVEAMLAKGVIRPANSPWSSPVVLVVKKNGSIRFCVNYKKLNDLTRKDAYPLPRTEELLETIAGHKVYSTIDLYSGYWQIPMEDDSVAKTTFVCREGTFEFLVMPFGLTNAPATFQRIMDAVLTDYIDRFVVVYLDDICIYSDSDEEHKRHLKLVCEQLLEWNLKINAKKSHFNQASVKFLGHEVGPWGIRQDESK